MPESVIRIKPNHYIHVFDNNTNVTTVVVGPRTFTRRDHENIILGPEAMITVPPRNYCKISNPVEKDKKGNTLLDQFGMPKIRHGDEEIRFAQDPFPLFPGESLKEKPTPLVVVQANQALRIRAVRDFEDKEGHKRTSGDEWLFKGPSTYTPRVEESVVEKVNSTIIKENEALKLRARLDCVDSTTQHRCAGEQWLVRKSGAYLPDVNEEIVGTVSAVVLTPTTALHLVANNTFSDVFNKVRKAGEEWLVTMQDTETYITDVYEQVKGIVKITTLNNRQFCVVVDPIGHDGRPRFGARELRRGEASFFLYPGERLENGIQDVYVLAQEEALLLRARSALPEEKKLPGDRWMLYGPRDFIPPVEVEVVEKRRAIPLDENEGIYVRDITTGKIRAHIGSSYMLAPNEELWSKVLPTEVDKLLLVDASRDKNDIKTGSPKARDPTRVVSYRVPHGAAVQVYDYEKKKSRVVFGPDLVLLQPDEHFTTLNMSGGVPKQSNQIHAISLFLGPDFMTDQITVETADHARLALKLSYNWHFEVDQSDQEAAGRIFSTPDFVGDLCKALSARVRGVVASTSFDAFHKHSVDIIQESVFGRNTQTGEINDRLVFSSNNLVVTNIDIQSVEPVDQRTRDSLQKSVQLAIEITTKSQEATARQEAERLDQEARGRLERQKLADEAEAERARKSLLELQAQSATVESTGQATAEARALAAASTIEGEAAVKQATLSANSATITAKAALDELKKRQGMELAHKEKLTQLEVKRTRDLAEIETTKFGEVVSAIGPETIRAIAQAGPEMQAKLLNGLGLKSLMITDGNSPINLFNTASGLVSAPASGH
ncbi:major vault protein [Pelomyxa schiedti]|nr:major vault protein [Pelomyxa schiedti]